MPELKPCPKCGERVRPIVVAVQHTLPWETTILCRNYNCNHRIVRRGIILAIARKKAEKAWNRYSAVVSIPSIDAPWS